MDDAVVSELRELRKQVHALHVAIAQMGDLHANLLVQTSGMVFRGRLPETPLPKPIGRTDSVPRVAP